MIASNITAFESSILSHDYETVRMTFAGIRSRFFEILRFYPIISWERIIMDKEVNSGLSNWTRLTKRVI